VVSARAARRRRTGAKGWFHAVIRRQGQHQASPTHDGAKEEASYGIGSVGTPQPTLLRSVATTAFHGCPLAATQENSVITSRLQVSGTVPAALGCMRNVAGFFVAGTLPESVASLVQPQTLKLPHRELANIHCAEPVLASTAVTPSTASTGGSTVPRRRFQRGTLIVRGKKTDALRHIS
jgi:hypothetical protein